MADQAQQTPEGRLYAAGFTRQLDFWVTPDGERVLSMDDAIEKLDSGEIKPGSTARFPDTGVRALPDDLVDRILGSPPPPPPPWLEELADLVAEKLKPVVRAGIRAALKAASRRGAA
jgi:hypothetical protein